MMMMITFTFPGFLDKEKNDVGEFVLFIHSNSIAMFEATTANADHHSHHITVTSKSSQRPIALDVAPLCDQLNNTPSLSNLPLGLLAEPPRTHNQRHLWETALSEHLAVSEG